MTKKAFSFELTGIIITLVLVLTGELYRFHGILLIDLWTPFFAFAWLGKKTLEATRHKTETAYHKPGTGQSKQFAKKHIFKIYKPEISYPATLFVLIGIGSLLVNSTQADSEEFLKSALYCLRWMSMFLLCLIAADEAGKSAKKRSLITWALFVFGVFFAIAGFIQLNILPTLHNTVYEVDLGWDPHVNRLFSTWFDPNFAGGILAFILILISGEIVEKKETRKYTLPMGVIMLTALFLTLSRSGYLALITGLSVFIILFTFQSKTRNRNTIGKIIKKTSGQNLSKKIFKYLPVLVLLAFFLLSVNIISSSQISSPQTEKNTDAVFTRNTEMIFLRDNDNFLSEKISGIVARAESLINGIRAITTNPYTLPDESSRLRFDSWKTALELIKEKPIIGHGYNRYKYAALEQKLETDPQSHASSGSDSSLLTIAATSGILGLLAFLTTYFMLAIKALRKEKKRCPEWEAKTRPRSYSTAFLGGMTALFVHSIFVNSLLFPLIMAPFWLAAGLLPGLKYPRQSTHYDSQHIATNKI